MLGIEKVNSGFAIFSILVKLPGCDVVCYLMEPNLLPKCSCSIGFPENPCNIPEGTNHQSNRYSFRVAFWNQQIGRRGWIGRVWLMV